MSGEEGRVRPVRRVMPEGGAGLGPADGGGTDPLRVLLVDDQQLVRSGFAMILSVEDDLTVVGQAADGAQALVLARELRPDVILMDVQMPVLDGIAATARIVAEDLGKVVILTTFDRDDYLFDALRAGASGFLLKNAEPEHLVDAVRAVGHGHALLAPEVTRRVIAQMVASSGDGHDGTGEGGPPERSVGPLASGPGRQTPGAASARNVPSASAAGTGRDGTHAAATSVASSRNGADAPPSRSAVRSEDRRLARLTEREREVLALVARGRSNAEIAAELFLGEATVKTHVSNCLAKFGVRDRVQAVVVAYEVGLASAETDRSSG